MNYYNPADLDRIAKYNTQLLEDNLSRIGIFHRIFYRCKSRESLETKVNVKNIDDSDYYDGKTKFLRDIIGIRITLYFLDDLKILLPFFLSKDNLLEKTIDHNQETEFKPTRINIVFSLAEEYRKEFRDIIADSRIDSSFELQLRTVLSEGWHEVDHDLRYKCKNDWENYIDLSRTFNGFLASLETNDWAIINIFEKLSYEHYKNRNWIAMFRTKFRLRLQDYELDEILMGKLNEQNGFVKDLYRIQREEIILMLLDRNIYMPLTLNNILYATNYFLIKEPEIIKSTPKVLIQLFNN